MMLALVLTLATLGQAQQPPDNCKAATVREFSHDMRRMGSGVLLAPKHAIQPGNLKWEIPAVAATVLMVNYGDTPASRQIQNTHVENAANRFSNVGLWTAWGLGGAIYAMGCAKHQNTKRSVGLQALEAGLSAAAIDSLVKYASNRVRPDRLNSQGNFWGAGGRSFASGHAATSFGIATALAHHTQTRWKKIALYGLAGAVSFARFPAKKHFLTDIFVGSAIGYIVGDYMADSPPVQVQPASNP
jgi:membrane-associated phospholipid phosphatase